MSVLSRNRRRPLVAVAVALLAFGGLAACGTEEPTTEKASSSDSKDADSKGSKDSEEGSGESGDDEKGGALAAGDSAVYKKAGLKITVTKATVFTPGEYSDGHSQGNKAYKVAVTLENTGSEKADVSLVDISGRYGEEGKEAGEIFDGETMGEGFDGNLLPGKKATASYGFDVAPAAKVLDVEVTLNDFESEPAQWELKL
ncbi:DUF4352 domain-containing protein [Streptomyces boncukensis]|uniref:DUF4352 domain-containing protein n=1 Tax=Streptomyces boncukensis TaxID=2711219 RepID=A0A6G4X8M7_9ACTN|nr:DUF4352 domain-containing protein [Streptomyces boncukensis]NGO73104.1 DUF4352 domain-containing protein [Streptomyces boncukensis]